ncbi:MAG: hypothetical protein NC218_05575 [Acetobacter sp.]|nr:hypothetical protein [Acetobacter sp.]
MLKKFNRFYVLFFILLVLNIGMVLFHYGQKDGFHIDEIFSFGHANSTQGAFLAPTVESHFYEKDVSVLYNQWFDGKVFHNYITVQPEEQFRYGHIFENLKKSTHPPLYYMLLHTVCSFFPEQFSKWFGAGVNIALWVALLIMLFKLAELLLEDEFLAMMAVTFYAFSEAGIDTVLYIRMYILQTLFAVCLLYEIVKMLKENEADNKRLFLIFLYSSLGMLTQYSSLVFSFLAAGTGGGILFLRRNWNLLFRYAVVMAFSPLVLFVLFPTAWNVLLYSARGEELIRKITPSSTMVDTLANDTMQSRIWEMLWQVDLWLNQMFYSGMWRVYMQQLLSFSYLPLWFVLLFLGICVKWKRADATVWYILINCVLMSAFLNGYMPPMYEFSVRYYMLLLPLVSVLTVYFLKGLLVCFELSSKRVYVLLGVFVLANSLLVDFGKKSAFTFNYDANTERFLEEVKQRDVVVFTETSFMYLELVAALYDSHQILLADKSCKKDYAEDIREHKGAYVLFFNADARRCVSCAPKYKTSICQTLRKELQYKFLVRVGERYYDVYEVLNEV